VLGPSATTAKRVEIPAAWCPSRSTVIPAEARALAVALAAVLDEISVPRRGPGRPRTRPDAGRAGGRPPHLDQQIYKGRNVVERSFALLKQWRGLATRYDKLAVTYRAAVVLSACITWLRHMGDTP
jgi:transposase